MRRILRWLGLGLAAVLIALIWQGRLPAPPPDLPQDPALTAPIRGVVDRILIDKSDRRLQLIQDGRVLRSYRVALGFSPNGPKERQGDGKTPEGLFRIDRRNDRSAFHLSLGLDYPQPADRRRARAGGYDPGGDIMIHGQPNRLSDDMRLPGDWTAGCIALTNAEMREVWAVTDARTLVEIRP